MEEIEELAQEEFRLAQQLKVNFCDKSGKETEPKNAAEIIYRIGLIYRKRSPDKISLIKSVGLFNAALVRNPSNVSQIKLSLSEICQHILRQANAKKQNADLIKRAQEVKASINEIRDRVNSFLENAIPKIPATSTREHFQKLLSSKVSSIQLLNKTFIADNYKQIMAKLSQFCEEVMGKPPCKYSIAGMGSLARDEITPYSDFEHIIILANERNYKSYLEYFRWFSVIFHVVLLNVQESIIPSLNINSLNGKDSELKDWYYDAITPRGISFDGMMPHACKFPLGRHQHTKHKQFTTELIKPVSEMLEYLSSEADLKNGYHLADILTKTCFVFGNKNIYAQFADGAQNYRNSKSHAEIVVDVVQQIKDDLNNFSTRFRLTELKKHDSINIKQLVYRSTTIFIAALSRLHNLSSNSCLDLIDEMKIKNIITKNAAEKLRSAISIACEMRLRVYMKNKSQCDNVINLQYDGADCFLEIVGVASTVYYFQIAYCLQCEVAKQLKFTKLHFYSNPQLINITIGLAFGIRDLGNFSKSTQNFVWSLSDFDFDTCIEQLEMETNLNYSSNIFQKLEEKYSKNICEVLNTLASHLYNQSNLNTEQIKLIANCLDSSKVCDEAIEFYKQLLDIKKKHNTIDYDVAWANHQIGCCLMHLDQSVEALPYLNQALEIHQLKSLDVEKDISIAQTLNSVGACHIYLQNYNDALLVLNKALLINEKMVSNASTIRTIASLFHNIGGCQTHLQSYGAALTSLKQALEIKQNITLNAEKDRSIADTLYEISYCHYEKHSYGDALTCLNKALEIFQNTSLKADVDGSIAKTYYQISRCHFNEHRYEVALTYLSLALDINSKATLEVEKDKSIARILHMIGCCHYNLRNYDAALLHLNRALAIEQNTALDAKTDKDIVATLQSIDSCHIALCK